MWSWLGCVGGGGGESNGNGIADASTSLPGSSSPLSSGAAPQSGAVFQLTERVLAFVYGAADGNQRERAVENS